MGEDGNKQTAWAAALYDACAADLVLYGRAIGLTHAEAEDVLHDSFRALLGLDSRPREPRYYLVRTFRNRALNHRRSLWRRLAREMESHRWFDPDPESGAAAEAAAVALSALPPEQREVIVLHLWHGLTFEAVGELQGISPNTAAGRYRYGLQKLRNLLKQPDHELELDSRAGKHPAWIPPAAALSEGQGGSV